MYYLAVNYGCYEGWKLTPYDSPDKALQSVKDGETYGQEWKVLKELDVLVKDEEVSHDSTR